jgi:hypothetical protein
MDSCFRRNDKYDKSPSPPAYRQAGSPLPCLRRSGFAQAGVKGEGEAC